MWYVLPFNTSVGLSQVRTKLVSVINLLVKAFRKVYQLSKTESKKKKLPAREIKNRIRWFVSKQSLNPQRCPWNVHINSVRLVGNRELIDENPLGITLNDKNNC